MCEINLICAKTGKAHKNTKKLLFYVTYSN